MADMPMFEPTPSFPPHAIAIVGLAGRFPGTATLEAFWRNIAGGVELLEEFSDADLAAAGVDADLRSNPSFVRKGTTLAGAELFDAGFFGISPREAQILDPQQRIFLECAWEALEHAGYAPGSIHKTVGVFAGASMNTYVFAQILRDQALMEAVGGYQLMLGNDKDFLCTRVSYKLDLHGPSMTIQTACSTSLVAVEVACRSLQSGECDMALAGGVSLTFPARSGYLHAEGMILSPDGHCRPFDSAAAGTRAGAGAGIVVLKRLRDALADRDTIHAVIIGAAVNNDGASKIGYTAPSIDGQVEVIATAQALAGVDPRSITYVEAHGTATPLGDPIEIAALTRVFRAATPDVGFCRLGSLKANLGHLDAAAGVAGLIKTVLALTHQQIPPLVNFRSPNPKLDLEHSPFTASPESCAWPDRADPRRAGVSSFGIGGTNAHVVLQEAPPVPLRHAEHDHQLLVLSARTAIGLQQTTTDLAAHLEAHPHLSLQDVAWTLQVGRKPFPHRCAVPVQDVAQAVALLRQPHHASVAAAVHEGGTRPVAFLFSGQGSQHVGMGAELYRRQPVYRAAIDRCATLLQPMLGLDIRTVMFAEGTDNRINETRLTQPALFCTEYALATLWMQWGVSPTAMMGHSIGEYVAAHLAGVFSLADALLVVATRGRLMQALPPGTMAAVHASAADLAPLLPRAVEIAAENAPGLCAISGATEPVATAMRQLQARGFECRTLVTSHAFHSAMMEPALAPFIETLRGITLSPPRIPYVSNVTGTWITPVEATSPEYYATHMRRAVRFEPGMRTLKADPALCFLEVGPGNALATLARATLGKERGAFCVSSLSHPRRQDNDARAALEAAGRLFVLGAALDWPALHLGAEPRRIPLPTYPFERQRYCIETPPTANPTPASDASVHGDGVPRMYAPTWMRDELLAGATPSLQGPWIVLAPAGPLAAATIEALRAAGAVAVLAEPGDRYEQRGAAAARLRHDSADDVAALVRDVTAAHGALRGIILLAPQAATGAEHGAAPAQTYRVLVALAAGLDAWDAAAPITVLVVSAGARSVLGEPVADPAAALPTGPVLVLPTEAPGLRIRSVDLAIGGVTGNPAEAARLLVEEAAADGAENFVAWRNNRRWLQRFQPVTPAPSEVARLPLKHRAVYLITGGLGGIGLALAAWLAAKVSARLLLTARRAVPARETWDAILAGEDADAQSVALIRSIREIEAAGGEVMTAAADAADHAAMSAAITAARIRWGALDGVIHAAGVPGNGRIAVRQEDQEVRDVLAPKVDGLAVLADLLRDTPLDFVVLMSSINAVVGAPGACSYAAANAVLDAFADSEARPAAWKRVIAINWGPWRDVGMAANLVVPPAMQAQHLALLRNAIAPEAGVDAFARILGSRHSRVVVTPYDLHAVLDMHRDQPRHAPETPASSAAPEAVSAATFGTVTASDRPATPIERTLAAIWSELTGVHDIGVHDDFFDLGGHSLLATRVIARVGAQLGVRLTLRDIFAAPTIRRLAGQIGEGGAPDVDAADLSSDDREEILI